MAKINEPYKCSFSISYAIASRLSQATYELGKFAVLTKSKAGNEEFAQSAIYLLSMMGISLRNAEMRGLRQGSPVPSTPLANELFALQKNISRVDPYEKAVLQNFENALWKDGVPYRLSRKAEGFPYIVPMHARVDALLDGVFSFAKANKAKIHPLILSAVMLFEIMAIAPYREHNFLAGLYVAKAILVDYDPIFAYAPIERFFHLKKAETDEVIAKSVEKGDMAPFLSYVLSLYEEALMYIRKYRSRPVTASKQVEKLLAKMEDGKFYSASDICTLLGLKSRLGIQLNYIRPALEARVIVMSNPGAPTDRNQRYKKA